MIKYLSHGATNAKTKKNDRETLILYLAPLSQNSKGINLCPKASPGCSDACLFTAGRGAFTSVIKARVSRTETFLNDRGWFMARIADEIRAKAAKVTGELAVRLNGTSDIKLVELLLASHVLPTNVVFYDYTKIAKKAGERVINGHRYVVAFSRAENNEKEALSVLAAGGIVAVVFPGDLPDAWHGFPVVDGDSRDDLMLDVAGPVVLGLKAKGKAKRDITGFVFKG